MNIDEAIKILKEISEFWKHVGIGTFLEDWKEAINFAITILEKENKNNEDC